MIEWPDNCMIRQVVVYGPVGEYGNSETYEVGYGSGKGKTVTEIRPIMKSGPYCGIPYVQVWCEDHLYAEFCQHQVQGVYFDAPPKEE